MPRLKRKKRRSHQRLNWEQKPSQLHLYRLHYVVVVVVAQVLSQLKNQNLHQGQRHHQLDRKNQRQIRIRIKRMRNLCAKCLVLCNSTSGQGSTHDNGLISLIFSLGNKVSNLVVKILLCPFFVLIGYAHTSPLQIRLLPDLIVLLTVRHRTFRFSVKVYNRAALFIKLIKKLNVFAWCVSAVSYLTYINL